MFRLLFVMVTTVLVGLGTGYFLWGNRAARLTEAVNTLTLEMDTMRERLKASTPQVPAGLDGGDGVASAASSDQLRVISESIASLREEVAAQKELLAGSASAAAPLDPSSASVELRNVRNELAACVADKRDLEMRQAGRVPAPPAYQPQAFTPPPAPEAARKAPAPTPPAADTRPDLSPPPAAPPAAESPPVNLDDPRY